MSAFDLLIPQMRVAQAAFDPTAFGKVVDPIISNIVYPVIYVVFALGVFVFAYGVLEMIWKGGDAEARKTGRMHILFGVIGMFIMISAWGIIALVSNTLKGINNSASNSSQTIQPNP